MAKKENEVIESIKKIDSELLDLWSKEDILENENEKNLQDIQKIKDKKWKLRQEKARIIEENHEMVLLNDARAVTEAIDVFRSICSEEYSYFRTVKSHLVALQIEINEKLDEVKDSSVNAVEEEPVEEEAK